MPMLLTAFLGTEDLTMQFLFCSLIIVLVACGGNRSKKDSGGGGGPVIITEPTEVENDGITTIDTRDRAEKHTLSFNTSGKQEFGRYLSEYLLVVKASESSCVRLKVRPAEAIDSPLDDDRFDNTDPDASACQAPQGGQQDDTDEEQDDNNEDNNDEDDEDNSNREDQQSDNEDETTNLRLTKKSRNIAIPMRDDHRAYLDTIIPTLDKRSTFSITSNPAVCSISIFRMSTTRLQQQPDIEGTSLDATVTKTGRLLVVSKNRKVRLWVDEEYGNPCRAVGQAPGDFTEIAFDPEVKADREIELEIVLNEESRQPEIEIETKIIWDKLSMSHLQNLADESEKAHDRLTNAFGPVSDVDANGSVDIFLSPDVNREYFFSAATIPRRIDDFRLSMIYKPNDLAPYNSQTNSASNEGEILYMWVPDPAGIYTYDYFSSANSLTTNYAKGFIASQLMTMIILNHKLIVDNRNADEQRWLIDMLSMLAASYIGGNDYVFHPLVQYLTARTHNIDLFPDIPSHATPNIADDERQGLQLMFAWYLHSRLCGKKVTICEELKSLIDTELTGEQNLQNTFGADIDDLMLHFGLSIGTQISDDPQHVRKLFNATQTSLQVPLELPEFDRANEAASTETEVSPSDPPLTVELGNDGGNFCTPNPEADCSQNPETCDRVGVERSNCDDSPQPPTGANAQDRTHATPFPNIENLIYQIIMPDNDMDLKVVANSVSYILLTGLTSQVTDMIGTFGRGLQVVVLPLGDRNYKLRKMYHEKPSELAPMDTTPINLTDALKDDEAKAIAKETRTYYADPPFPQETMHEWTLENKKELWLTGSIDTFDVNGVTGISDSDAYNIKVNVPEASLVLVQTKVRDIDEQLKPFILVTTPDARIFKGRAIWAKYDELKKNSGDEEGGGGDGDSDDTTVKVLCQSASSWRIGNSNIICANGGLSPEQYRDRRQFSNWLSDSPLDPLKSWLTLSGLTQAATFDATNNPFSWNSNEFGDEKNYGFNHIFDNFLFAARKFSHPNRFNNTVFSDEEESEEEEGTTAIEHRKFSQQMASRQWFNFAYDKKLKPTTYQFWAVDKDVDFESEIEESDWRDFISQCEGVEDKKDKEELKEECEELKTGNVDCEKVHANCGNCNRHAGSDCGLGTPKFISAKETAQSLTTYYDPVYLNTKDTTPRTPQRRDSCRGGGDPDYRELDHRDPEDNYTNTPYQTPCPINQPAMRTDDIRRQLNVDASRVWPVKDTQGCRGEVINLITGEIRPATLGEDFDVCLDGTVTSMDGEDSGDVLVYQPIYRHLVTDRKKQRCSPLDNRRGEIVGKSGNINYTMFYVPAGESIFNLIIGGMGGSTGKYTTRIKLFGEAGKCR